MSRAELQKVHSLAHIAAADALADHAVRLRSEARRMGRLMRAAEMARLRKLKLVAQRFRGETIKLPRAVLVAIEDGAHWIDAFHVGTLDPIQLFPQDGSLKPGEFLPADKVGAEIAELLDLVTLALKRRLKKRN